MNANANEMNQINAIKVALRELDKLSDELINVDLNQPTNLPDCTYAFNASIELDAAYLKLLDMVENLENSNEAPETEETPQEVSQSESQETNETSNYVNELGGIFDVGEIIEACQIIGF